jgi:Zn-dependent metalloprotease
MRTMRSGACATPCQITPPSVLRAIAQNGDASQRATALRTLASDQTLRLTRASYQLLQPHTHRLLPEAVASQKRRSIYDAQGDDVLPGSLIRVENSPAGQDVAVNEAYDGLGATWDFFHDVYHRNSIDDEGMPLDASVHFRKGYDNAFWDGQQMVFGDGDGELFNRFTIALEVIGHELTHGVTGDEAGLVYLGQSGALNESVSDCFGSLVKQYARGETAKQADWLIGEGLLGDGVKGKALRSMKAPGTAFDDPVLGKDDQPAHMKDFVHTSDDGGGVHTNSGIPNHAFYLIAIAIGGRAWVKAGRIWYETLRDPRLRTTATFARFAQLTAISAARLYGANSVEQKAVIEGWRAVGVPITSVSEEVVADAARVGG